MSKKHNKTNVILIMSDDLGYEVLGCNGGSSYETPVLDKLATKGINFTEAHVQPLCTPTRLQLMTGKYNSRNYIGFGLMKPDEKTFGHIMTDAGYKTLISGKWQLYSYNPPEVEPQMRNKGQKIEDAGFDEYCVWHAHHTEDKGSRYKDPVIYQNGSYLDDTKGQYGEDIFCDYILDFIDRNQEEPFFVYFPMALTHRPFEPTPDSPEYEKFDPPTNKNLGTGKNFEQVEGWQDDPKYYKDMVEYHDKIVGRIIHKLDELDLSENTLVIYIGDNGTPVEVSSQMGSTSIQGGKGLPNDRGTHVPLICSMPGTINPGVNLDLIDSTDILATILDITKTPLNDFIIDGQSFLPQLSGQKGNPRDWLYFYYDPKNPRRDARSNREFKYVFARDEKWKLYDDGKLFDLVNDLEETEPIFQSEDTSESNDVRKKLTKVIEDNTP